MKKWILCALFVATAACGGDDDSGGDLGDLGDLVAIDGAPGQFDARPGATCQPSGSCLQGPPCGDDCCGSGEQCINGQLGPICACGEGPACEVGQSCEAAGPVGEDGCGTICCGGADPCPQ